MQLKVLQDAVAAITSELGDIDVEVLSGADASAVAQVLAPCKHRVDAVLFALAARAVEVNQHNVDGSPHGAAWVAEVVGVSEKAARSQLATQRALGELPDVGGAVRSGEISLDKAAAVGRAAHGDVAMAAELLEVARHGSVEMVELRGRELRAQQPDDGSRRRHLRESQYINASLDPDSMVRGSFCLLPEFGMDLFSAAVTTKARTAWEIAEEWARRIRAGGGGGKRPELVFHLELAPDGDGGFGLGDRCELKGVGPVPMSSVAEVLEDASRTLVGTVGNKLAFFSTEDRRSTTAQLPEWVKRAVRSKAYDRCETSGCAAPAEEVDHTVARCNDGNNEPENLKALCRPHHDAKTKIDAPWTAGGIYGKPRKDKPPPSKEVPPAEGRLFADTG